MRTILAASFLFVASIVPGSAQDSGGIPDAMMAQVVSRILRYNFGPADDQRTIFIWAEGMKEDWLPRIRGRNFALRTAKALEKDNIYSDRIYFFVPAVREGRHFKIGFGHGDPDCTNDGVWWNFRIVRGRVHLWIPTSQGWGSGCA